MVVIGGHVTSMLLQLKSYKVPDQHVGYRMVLGNEPESVGIAICMDAEFAAGIGTNKDLLV